MLRRLGQRRLLVLLLLLLLLRGWGGCCGAGGMLLKLLLLWVLWLLPGGSIECCERINGTVPWPCEGGPLLEYGPDGAGLPFPENGPDVCCCCC